jgi:DnaJ-class molecular chaperone
LIECHLPAAVISDAIGDAIKTAFKMQAMHMHPDHFIQANQASERPPSPPPSLIECHLPAAVNSAAIGDAIKTAFKTQAMQMHPDRLVQNPCAYVCATLV